MQLKTRLFITLFSVTLLSMLAVGFAFLTTPFLASLNQYSLTSYSAFINTLPDSFEAFSTLDFRLGKTFMLSLCVTFTGLLVFCLWLSRWLSLPLSQLAQASRQIKDGYRFSPSSRVYRHSETRLIARTLLNLQTDAEKRDSALVADARNDRLTKLPNQLAAIDTLESLIDQQRPFIVLRMALHDLRAINSTFGYSVGDQMLSVIADRLRQLTTLRHHAFRLTDNEFLIIHEDDQPDARWLPLFLHHLSHTITVNAHSSITPAYSIGEVSFPATGNTTQQLLQRADIALQQARDKGVQYERYSEGLDKLHLRRRTLINDLPKAVSQNEFWIDYQPKVSVETGQVRHFEALIRWHHPSLGLIRPDEFIELAERSGNVSLLSQWLLTQVCQQLHIWNQSGRLLSVAINLSANDIIDSGLPIQLTHLIKCYDLEPWQLSIEVTESTAMQDANLAVNVLKEIAALGVSLAIDDFGTGYSSLAQLKRLPFNKLKIDKSFILGLSTGSDDLLIVRSTIELGHRLGLKVVAEGVENQAAASLLYEMGCDFLQGYWISKPMPSHQVLSWLESFTLPR